MAWTSYRTHPRVDGNEGEPPARRNDGRFFTNNTALLVS